MKERETKKQIKNLLFLMLLIGLTFIVLLKDQSFSGVLPYIKKAKPVFLILGMVCMVGYVAAEANCNRIIMRSLGRKMNIFRCMRYASIGLYFSSITPSATGGQPAQIYYMNRDDIPVSHSTLSLLILMMMYQLVEVGVGLAAFILNPEVILNSNTLIKVMFFYGLSFHFLMVLLSGSLLFSSTLVKRILYSCIRGLTKIRIIKNTEKVYCTVDRLLSEYKEGARFLKKNPVVFFKVFLSTVCQFVAILSVPFFAALALGVPSVSYLTVFTTQSILMVAVSSIPLPGTVGASESAFLVLQKGVFGEALVMPGMLLSRGISFYLTLLATGTVTIFTHIAQTKKKKELSLDNTPLS